MNSPKNPYRSFLPAAFISLMIMGLLAACQLSSRFSATAPAIASTTAEAVDPPAVTATEIGAPATFTPFPSPSPTLPPTATVTITPTLTPTSTATLESPAAEGWVIAGGVNLREGPGQLFPVLTTLPYHASVKVLNSAPGREWLHLQTEDGVTGWMMAQYVQVDLGMEAIGLAPISPDWITLKGSVKDGGNRPIVGAQAWLYDSHSNWINARSWEDSYFYLFLPKTSQGRWTLSVLRPVCPYLSANPACMGPGYFLDNPRPLEITGSQEVEVIYQVSGVSGQ